MSKLALYFDGLLVAMFLAMLWPVAIVFAVGYWWTARKLT